MEDVYTSATISTPQGSPLSPLFWNVVIHEVLYTEFSTGVHVQAYTDDTVLVASGRQGREVEDLANSFVFRHCQLVGGKR